MARTGGGEEKIKTEQNDGTEECRGLIEDITTHRRTTKRSGDKVKEGRPKSN